MRGWISYTGRLNLVVANDNLAAVRHRDQIVDPYVLPFLNANGPGFVFQQDNARPHVANGIKAIQNNEGVLPWPAVSPDLAPFEHV